MKTKSKLLIISSFALAMVASLVMAFAFMSVTKTNTAKVDADPSTITVYFYNGHNWGVDNDGADFYIHYWGGSSPTTWPGVKIQSMDANNEIIKAVIPSDVTGMVFNNGKKISTSSDNAKTKDITDISDNALYTCTSYQGDGKSNADKASVTSFTIGGVTYGSLESFYARKSLKNQNYYVIGMINGIDFWAGSPFKCVPDTAAVMYKDNNGYLGAAHYDDLTLKAEDEIKIIYIDNKGEWIYYGSDGYYGAASNVAPGANGTYNIRLTNNGGYDAYSTSLSATSSVSSFVSINATKSKQSHNGDYLLLMTGMNKETWNSGVSVTISETPTTAYPAYVGYRINGEFYGNKTESLDGSAYQYLDAKVYSTVNVNLSGTPTDITYATLYGSMGENDRLIVYELPFAANGTYYYTVQAVIMDADHNIIGLSAPVSGILTTVKAS